MKQFIYKTLIAVIAIVLVYELTIAKQIKEFTSQSEVLMTKEGRKDGVNKIREELKKVLDFWYIYQYTCMIVMEA